MALRIEDYALIGDCETAALVGRDGSIDWLCWPRFDSDACFAALLGGPEHGRWLIAPAESDVKVSRRYRPNTLILETRFESPNGAMLLIDFMPPGDRNELIRIVVGERGRMKVNLELELRFGYGTIVPWVTQLPDGARRAIAGPDMVVLQSPVPIKGKGFTTVAEFTVEAGDNVPFTMTYSPSHLPPPEPTDWADALDLTQNFWTDWVDDCRPAGRWSNAILRSLITLKALIYAPTGGIVAAPTTSLPEHIGGTRNWDYRFCWLRDATLTLLSLMNAGYYDEAAAWREWLLRAVAGSPDQIQIMYGIAGERRLDEWEVPWLPGYENSKPVRIGNGAHGQLQLDVYGEMMDALHQARVGGIASSDDGWAIQIAMLGALSERWREPDSSIWEVRDTPRHFVHSKVMAWVAFDRAIKSAEEFKLQGPIDKWKALRNEIHAEVCANGFDPDLGHFVQSYGSRQVDAGLLLMPAVGFLPVEDPRISGTIAAVERDLMIDGFVQRYDTRRASDGLPAGEGVFLACSFWLVDAYIMQGRDAEAEALFSRLVALCNDVGLLAEEYDTTAKRLVGNFPQAFSHIALVNSAFNLTQALKPVEQRGDGHAPHPPHPAPARGGLEKALAFLGLDED